MKPAAEVIRQASASSWTESKHEGQKNNYFFQQFLLLSFLYMTEASGENLQELTKPEAAAIL